MQVRRRNVAALPFEEDAAYPRDQRLFDRYAPLAVHTLCRGQPFHLAMGRDLFRELLITALPGFAGDATDAAAMITEEDLLAAVRAVRPITSVELDRAYPVLAGIGQNLGLSLEAKLVLTFVLEAHGTWFWENWSLCLGHPTRRTAAARLAQVLGIETTAVLRAAEPGGPLMACSLLQARQFNRHAEVFSHFAPNPELDASMLVSPEAWKGFFNARFTASQSPESGSDFSHIEQDVELMSSCLRNALQTQAKGTHILLYGSPGTGKTTLAHELVRRLGAGLYEIRKECRRGGDSDGEARLESFNLCQLLGNVEGRSLVLFDELEDLLPAARFVRADQRLHKGWICESLDKAEIPTLWTSNSLSGIDPAILRRFTLTFEVAIPPRKTRRKILDQYMSAGAVGEAWRERVAAVESLTPALIEQLARVADALPLNGAELEANLDRWLNARLQAIDKAPLPRPGNGHRFRCELLNTETDPERLIAGLDRAREGRLCLHGPPGTGKSAFAGFLAERLDLPAVLRRGSDLRSCWVGVTEQNIAEMFARATREGAVLILDEADSFLSTRAGRYHQWEMNETTEFLVQLESFQGIFCATTNRFEDLDPAFMRRFDLKVRFDYMSDVQREQFLKDVLREAGCSVRLKAAARDRLARLDQLTPGDYIAAQRHLRFSGQEVSQESLVAALVHEVDSKNIHKGRLIGFR